MHFNIAEIIHYFLIKTNLNLIISTYSSFFFLIIMIGSLEKQ